MEKLFIIAHKADGQTDTVTRGLDFAGKLNADAEIFSYSHESLPLMADYIPVVTPVNQEAIVEREHKRISQILNDTGREDIKVHSLWHKYLYEHAAQTSVNENFSLIVKAVHNSDRLTPTDWHLMRHTRVPVLFFNENPEYSSNNILLALDLTSKNSIKQGLNQKILKYGQQLAETFGLTLHIAHVVRMPTLVNDLDLVNNNLRAESAYKQIMPQLAEIGIPEEQIHVAAGDPEMCLYQISSQIQAKYFVIGARQRKGIVGYMLGNTAEAILSKVRSNMLVVPMD